MISNSLKLLGLCEVLLRNPKNCVKFFEVRRKLSEIVAVIVRNAWKLRKIAENDWNYLEIFADSSKFFEIVVVVLSWKLLEMFRNWSNFHATAICPLLRSTFRRRRAR